MAFYDAAWYCNAGDQSTTGYYAVAKRPQNAAVAAGQLVRQFTAPAVGSERVFVCIVAGTTANTTDATWVLTRGAKTTDGTATWQECTGASAVNGDLANTVNWTAAKTAGTPTLGAIIQRNSGASYQICSTAGTMAASEPSFSNTAGVTTADGTTTWTCLGAVSNFTGGQAPHARLANAYATNWFVAGNTIYVGDNHAESQSSGNINLTPAGGTASTMSRVLCHNHSSSYPPASGDLTTGASISNTGTGTINFNPGQGSYYIYGVAFRVGIGQSANVSITLTSSVCWTVCERCSFEVASTGAGASVTVSSPSSIGAVTWINSTVKFANVNQQLLLNMCEFLWQSTGQILVSGSSVPGNFINIGGSAGTFAVLEALDLSQLTGNIVANTSTGMGTISIKDCKLNAAATLGATSNFGTTIQLIRCDSGTKSYRSERIAYEGAETTETSITRVGGASDPTGQAQSRKIVTTANSQWLRPFNAEPYAIWNPTTGSNVTVTVYGTINAGSLPNNDDIWLEVEYFGSSATPLGTIVKTTKSSVLAANAAIASDGSIWNSGGSGAGWSPFKLVATLSSPQPGLAGYIHARVRAAKASTTYYLDPKVDLS